MVEGLICPHCGSEETEIVVSDYESELWECFNCGKTWTRYYDD